MHRCQRENFQIGRTRKYQNSGFIKYCEKKRLFSKPSLLLSFSLQQLPLQPLIFTLLKVTKFEYEFKQSFNYRF